MHQTIIQEKTIDRLMNTVYELGRIMRQRMLMCDAGEIHMGQVHAMIVIQERPGITMKELADALHITSPSATSFIDRLVKLGYIDREHDAENRRLVRLNISLEGQKILREKMTERRKIFAEILGQLNTVDQESLLRILGKLITTHSS